MTRDQPLTLQGAASHDASGIQTSLSGYPPTQNTGYTFAYDAENRLTSAVLANSQATLYLYDGEGRRVAKVVCPSGGGMCTVANALRVTWYVYTRGANWRRNTPAGRRRCRNAAQPRAA